MLFLAPPLLFSLSVGVLGGAATGATLASEALFRCPNAWPLRRAFLAYDAPTAQYSAQLLDYLASRFEFADSVNPYNISEIKQRNSRFYTLIHNSLSDNFVVPVPGSSTEEHEWLQAHAAEYGADPEDVYLHFWTDTEVTLEGQDIIVPGWQPGSPKPGATGATRDEARVPVYYKSLARRATNLSTPQLRALNRAYNMASVAQPIAGNFYWEGFFFDNAGNHPLIVTIVTSGMYPDGGQIAEHPTRAVVNSTTFQDWYWYQGIGLFMQEFRQWILQRPDDRGGRQLKIVPNVYNIPYLNSPEWDRSYVDFHPADTLFQEFEVNPTRDALREYPAIVFRQNTVAQAQDIDLFQPGLSMTAAPPAQGSFSDDEALVNSVSLHWVTRTPNVLILGHQVNAVLKAGWEQNTKGIFDVDLGPALGDPYVLATGTDQHEPGYAYIVYARNFACGLAIVRERGGSNEDFDPTTQIAVQLPGSFIPMDADGNAQTPTDHWILRNGQGQIFFVAQANYQGLWWHAPAGSESGWGINLAHQGEVIFGTWLTYDVTGRQWWLSVTANRQPDGSYAGALYESVGPAFDAAPFSPAQVNRTPVGTATLAFADRNNGTFAYSVNATSQTKAITRQVFGPLPICVFGAQPNLAAATNYQDLWWAAPAGSESGWGINLTHQGDTIFAVWFTFDHDRKPLWLLATAPRTAGGTYAGTLYRTTGPAFNAMPFDAAKVELTAVGQATLTFADGNTGTFQYSMNGISWAKTITRQVFQAPGTVCR